MKSPWFFPIMIVVYEVALWFSVKWLWALGVWKNQRNINKREKTK